jgi:RNA polymerase sigma-70 factor (ECF subfamily)
VGVTKAQARDIMGREITDAPDAFGQPLFATTHWSVVLTAANEEAPEAAAALERLCRNYWFPLYAYVRRRGYGPEDAQDLTQEFFWRLLDRNWLPQADRLKGRFRTFLLVAMNHFLANEWDRAKAVKRGGRILFQPLEDGTGEQRFLEESRQTRSPEELFEQRWATTLLQTVLSRLRQEAAVAGRLAQFEKLEIFLTGEKAASTYAELAAGLGTTEGALKMAVQRLRRRYGELLKEEIANTVASVEEIEDELRYLVAVLSG